jgi:hypothetical protein
MKGRLTRLAYALATGTREPALGLAADRRRSDGLGVTVSATPQPRARFGVGAPAQV